jgi:hypothetical protein
MALLITTPIGPRDVFRVRNQKLRAIYDWYFGAGEYDEAGTWGVTRPDFNDLLDSSDAIVNGEDFDVWRAKINGLNETEDYLALADGDGNLIVDAETGGVWVIIDA